MPSAGGAFLSGFVVFPRLTECIDVESSAIKRLVAISDSPADGIIKSLAGSMQLVHQKAVRFHMSKWRVFKLCIYWTCAHHAEQMFLSKRRNPSTHRRLLLILAQL